MLDLEAMESRADDVKCTWDDVDPLPLAKDVKALCAEVRRLQAKADLMCHSLNHCDRDHPTFDYELT